MTISTATYRTARLFCILKCLLIPYIQPYHNYCLIIQSNFTTVHHGETQVALFSANDEIQIII
ncbi:hypothetical protein HKD37_15G043833 [Glycine soja]|nr:hypothetical protein GmHk_15G044823 [Glycine max]